MVYFFVFDIDIKRSSNILDIIKIYFCLLDIDVHCVYKDLSIWVGFPSSFYPKRVISNFYFPQIYFYVSF